MKNWLKLGSFNAICDSCGLQFKSFQMRERWDGLMVDSACWEPRHPQDFLRVPEEHTETPWSRPEPADNFELICYLWSLSNYADLAEADCARADNSLFPYLLLRNLKLGF